MVGDVGEEIPLPPQHPALFGIVGDIAEILRAVVVRDIAAVRGVSVRVGGLEVIAVLIPAPGHRRTIQALNERNVPLDVGEIGQRTEVALGAFGYPSAHRRQRHGGEGQVFRDIAGRVVLRG